MHPKRILSADQISSLRSKRELGWSINELREEFAISYRSAYELTKGVTINPYYLDDLKVKRGGSKKIYREKIDRTKSEVGRILTREMPLTAREKLIALSMLYWGEGNKSDCILSNSDPKMIALVIRLIHDVLGIENDRVRVSIRVFKDMNVTKCVEYWETVTGVRISSINILEGKKQGKLKYGMCRVRVAKACDIIKLLRCFWESFADNVLP